MSVPARANRLQIGSFGRSACLISRTRTASNGTCRPVCGAPGSKKPRCPSQVTHRALPHHKSRDFGQGIRPAVDLSQHLQEGRNPVFGPVLQGIAELGLCRPGDMGRSGLPRAASSEMSVTMTPALSAPRRRASAASCPRRRPSRWRLSRLPLPCFSSFLDRAVRAASCCPIHRYIWLGSQSVSTEKATMMTSVMISKISR